MSAVESSFRKATRLQGIEMSMIVQITEAARARKAEGADIIALGTGEPDFDTPDHVKQAAQEAMWAGDTKYTATAGTAELKAAVREKYRRENNLDFAANEILISVGAKQVLFNAFMATLDLGDEVIIPAPYWTSYLDIVKVAGGVPVTVTCTADKGFLLTPDQLRAAITPKTRWLLLNSPGNPSGAAYDRDSLRALMDVVAEYPDLWVMSDDIYEHLVYDNNAFVSPLQVAPELRARILSVNGVSKAYAMTGWRIGYAAGPAALIKEMTVVQAQATSGACSISQAAAVAALNGPQELVATRCAAFQDRRDMVVSLLNATEGISCLMPEGAFYVFPSCVGLLGKTTPDGRTLATDMDFCTFILNSADVAVVPGSAFGAPGHFRISYAYAKADLARACRRIQQAVEQLT
jgi:aspartate aminotransferase|tara:strand:+ start:1841 stop:3061 length:1221 start_codon:yes stop_codon:yes gene_type:complete